MCKRSVSTFFMDNACAACGAQAAFSCPLSASHKESDFARAALMDTMLMVSIFIMIILHGLIPAIALSILAGIVFLAIRQGPTGWAGVPKKQPLFVF